MRLSHEVIERLSTRPDREVSYLATNAVGCLSKQIGSPKQGRAPLWPPGSAMTPACLSAPAISSGFSARSAPVAHARGLGARCIGLALLWLSEPEGRHLPRISAARVPILPIIVGQPALAPSPPDSHAPRIDRLDALDDQR